MNAEAIYVKKLTGTLKITVDPEVNSGRAYFAVVFMPYVGRLDTRVVKTSTAEELANFLIDIRILEDDATRWAGKARAEGVVLISPFERTDVQLKEYGLLN